MAPKKPAGGRTFATKAELKLAEEILAEKKKITDQEELQLKNIKKLRDTSQELTANMKEQLKYMAIALGLSVISSIWAVTSLWSILLVSPLVSRKTNLMIGTENLLSISLSTNTLALWSIIALL